MLDETDRKVINALQGGFPVCARPFAAAAEELDIDEQDLMVRVSRMKEAGVLSRFGPMYNVEAMGGAFCLCAMAVPSVRLDEVVNQVNSHREVAHNYERAHRLNVWFVLGTEAPERIDAVIREIECETGLDVYAFPKEHEFFVQLKVKA